MRLLFCSYTSIGLLGPSMVVAQELQRRGHEVAFATGPSMEPFLTQMNMPRIARGAKDGESFGVKLVWDGTETVRQIRHLDYACQQFSPDMLVGQALTWSAMVMRKYTGLPLALIGQAGYFWPTSEPFPYYNTYLPAFYKRVHDRYRLGMDCYEICCKMLKLSCEDASGVSYQETPLLGDLFLLQSVPEFEGYPALLPNRVHFIGDCCWKPQHVDPELQQWLEAGAASRQPLVYVQIGRILREQTFGQHLVEALGKLPVRVVASFGGASQTITSVPENFFVREHVLQGQVLPYAHAVVSSGTTTSVLGALTHGLPQLIIPANAEEPFDLAFRCLSSESGLCLNAEQATVEALQEAIEALLHRPALTQQAVKLQRAFASLDGPCRAADLIEELGQKRVPLLRSDSTSLFAA
ncbi:MAG: glycosyltransferase [Ktedonobacteraceae bacterium]